MEVGFTSLGSFSAWFARGAGVAPTAYRDRVRALARMPSSSPDSLQLGCMSLLEGALAQGLGGPAQFPRSIALPDPGKVAVSAHRGPQ
jgi:hypothetical protein